MIKIKRFENKPVNSNCYLVINELSNHCVVIDPGTNDCSNILPYLIKNNILPKYIILTHEHFDHIWGVNQLRKLYNVKLISNKFTSNCITDKKKNLSLFYDQIGFECSKANIVFEHSISLNLVNETFNLFCSPGHTDGSICINVKEFLFTGDTLIKNIKTVTKLPGGEKKLVNSHNIITNNFTPSTTILPGHESPFALGTYLGKNEL